MREIAGLFTWLMSHFLIPLVGVGGGVEAKEHVGIGPVD